MDFKKYLKQALDFCGFLNDDEQLSLTNLALIVFLAITAFRGLFGGAVFNISDFNWKVETIDVSSTLPLLFSLLNYGHRRIINNQNSTTAKTDNS